LPSWLVGSVWSWGVRGLRGKGAQGEGFCVLARLFVCTGGRERGLTVGLSLVSESGAKSGVCHLVAPAQHAYAHSRTRTHRHSHRQAASR
jgi:hypothetical protein